MIKQHFERHNNTKKHRGKIEALEKETKEEGANEQNEHKMSTNEHKMSTNEHKMSTNEHKMSTNEHKINKKNSQNYCCDYCNKVFSTKANKRRHELHFCKENDTSKDIKIRKLEKEKKKLEKKIDKLLDKVGNVTNNNNTNNIIVVNNYGKENTNYLTVDKIKALLDRPFDSVQELIKMLHFDSEHPENHNIKITNKKEPYALVWNDPIWELRKKKSVVKDIVDKGYMMIDTTHENLDESNSKFINFQDEFENEKNETKEKIEEETEMVIINETKKLIC
jgi:hypothetical protein